jgi:carnitine O-acetyltransferase
MWRFQKTLARWPVPSMEATLDRYVATVSPLLSDAELSATKRAVMEYKKKDGKRLHELIELLASENGDGCYIEGLWTTMYEELRCALPINVNPGFVMEDHGAVKNANANFKNEQQIERAARLIQSGARFAHQVYAGTLEPDVVGKSDRKRALCMWQTPRMIGSARVPALGRDRFHVAAERQSHVVVIAPEGRYYALDVLAEDGRVASRASLGASLRAIAERSEQSAARGERVVRHAGPMTAAQDRDEWATLRAELEAGGCGDTLAAIDNALFVVCLDDDGARSDGIDALLRRGLDGCRGTRSNRWYDKSVQLAVCPDGATTVNMEHTGYDGHTLLRFTEFVHTDAARIDERADTFAVAPSAARELAWRNVTDEQWARVDASQRAHTAFAESLDSESVLFDRFGKRALVSEAKVSPDAVAQMAFQVAFYRTHGRFTSTYESVMMKHYLHGRTETMRSVTPEAVALAKHMASPRWQEQRADGEALMRAAASAHQARLADATAGNGVDRYLYAASALARQLRQRVASYQVPALFADAAFARLAHSELSTSNCGGVGIELFGFGAVVPNGLGIGYMIRDADMHINITSFTNQSKHFSAEIEQALCDLHSLFQ